MAQPPQPAPLETFTMLASSYEVSSGGSTRELATQVIPLLSSVDATSNIHDNACGNGIVAQEILYKYPDVPLKITCTDMAPAMIDQAREFVQSANSAATLDFHVMDSVDINLPDNTFTHSITNMGIAFFSDPARGAAHIHRTLQPGGTAILTSWASIDHTFLIHEAQRAIDPNPVLFRWPVSDDWWQTSHLENVLREAGFSDVQMSRVPAHFACSDVEGLTQIFKGMYGSLGPKWEDEAKKEAFERKLGELVRQRAIKIQRRVNGKPGAEMKEVVGFQMVAYVAVARK
ncbi:S-adenosyl-L-methionine-dependent methyltransferase [Decorospora gaudefroyi]|uniref:S-adenosyl-L-methionine-dependent methyltransferase n=1 Tax=Decorospora gaudefroyi TaxID=184978 RepID=A0A6A5KWU7_9PLEO|nr:S-adenosyl-L-methionine-dependent methyltransferase [Decorospora gaudefroyi]